MIALNELRIGNFIQGPLTVTGAFYPDIAPIEPVELQIRLDHFVWLKANPELHRLLMPIALTPEWMLKFSGAKEHELKWDLHQYIMVVLRYERFFLYYADKGYLLDVKYVHQLQNICFALTGEELSLNTNRIAQ
jgi:hypothetical protein